MSQDAHLTGTAPERTIEGGLFPFSARANAREGIFSDILAVVLQCEPTVAVAEESKDDSIEWEPATLKDRLLAMEVDELDLTDDVNPETIWDVYEEKYTTTTQGRNLIAVPFNAEIPKRLRPINSNKWGTWYRLHLSELEDDALTFDDGLHRRFRARLEELNPSNVFERAIVSVVRTFEASATEVDSTPEPLRPYLEDAARHFRTDLRAWLNNDIESSSDWLQGCQDLIGIHFFMYYVQVALNLREEWILFTDLDESEVYQPRVIDFPFGIESESANLDRPFVQIWGGKKGVEFSIEQEIYNSWGRLAVLRILNNALDHQAAPNYPLTLTEARELMDEESRRGAIDQMVGHLPERDPPEDAGNTELIETAEHLTEAIDLYYRYDVDDAAPLSMGVRGVRRLADADTRFLSQSRGRPGFRLQMADETLAFLARVFASDETRDESNLGFKHFVEYLARRGFDLDQKSQSAARSSLDSMGLLEQESDSGESVNVRIY